MPKAVDANIIIRYLLGDSPAQVQKIKHLLQDKSEKLILADVIVAEIVWVLSSYYKQSKEEIVEELLSLIEMPVVSSNKPLITQALSLYREYNIDYIDAYLISFAKENKLSGVLSYDKSIDKVKETKRFEP